MYGTIGIVGDLFIFANDEGVWQSGSQDQAAQLQNRNKVICLTDYIIPGHGQMFAVTPEMKQNAGCRSFRQEL
jgi:hypothetical protein